MTHLYVFGDSIVQGAWDPFGGWVQRVRSALDNNFMQDPAKYCVTYNMGIMAQTSNGLLSFFKEQMQERHDTKTPAVFLFSIGMNDTAIDFKMGTPFVSLKKFQSNIETLIDQAKEYSSRIGFVGLNPVDETLTNPVSWSQDKAYWNANILEYNECLKQVCMDRGIKYIDVWSLWRKDTYQDWLFDGLHPNEIGHQKIAKAVLTHFLKPLGWFVPPESEQGYMATY